MKSATYTPGARIRSKKRGGALSQWIVGAILTLGGVLFVLPFVWMLISSLKTEADMIRIPPSLWPHPVTFANFPKLFKGMDFAVYLKNTLIIVLFSFVGLFLNAMAGFAFGKYRFKGRASLFLLVLATMMIPSQVTMIPTYLILNSMHLTNTMAGIVLPGFANSFMIFLLRQFMTNIPDEILEATRMDGSGEFRLFVRIILPMSAPILAVQAILTFIGGWNSFLWPLIIANSDKLYTLSVGLSLLQGQHGGDYALQMAGAAFMVVPIIVIFMFFQRQIIDNYAISGVK